MVQRKEDRRTGEAQGRKTGEQRQLAGQNDPLISFTTVLAKNILPFQADRGYVPALRRSAVITASHSTDSSQASSHRRRAE